MSQLQTRQTNGSIPETAMQSPELQQPFTASGATLQIREMLERRMTELLQQLNAFKSIQSEYAAVSRAYRAISGDPGPGRPTGHSPSNKSRPAATLGPQGRTPDILRILVRDGALTSAQVAEALDMDTKHGRAKIQAALGYARYKKNFVKMKTDGRYAITTQGHAYLGDESSQRPGPKTRALKPVTVKPRAGIKTSGISTFTVLKALNAMPHGGNASVVATQIGDSSAAAIKKIGVILAYTATRKLAMRKSPGVYAIAVGGREFLGAK